MKTRVLSVSWLNWFWSWLTQQCEVIPGLIKGFIRAEQHPPPPCQLLRQSLFFLSTWVHVCVSLCVHMCTLVPCHHWLILQLKSAISSPGKLYYVHMQAHIGTTEWDNRKRMSVIVERMIVSSTHLSGSIQQRCSCALFNWSVQLILR